MDWEVRDTPDEEILELGSLLSIVIDCPVRYPAYDKGLFECKCKKTFMLHSVREGKWEDTRAHHKEG